MGPTGTSTYRHAMLAATQHPPAPSSRLARMHPSHAGGAPALPFGPTAWPYRDRLSHSWRAVVPGQRCWTPMAPSLRTVMFLTKGRLPYLFGPGRHTARRTVGLQSSIPCCASTPWPVCLFMDASHVCAIAFSSVEVVALAPNLIALPPGTGRAPASRGKDSLADETLPYHRLCTMHTLSTLRFPAMNIGVTETNLDDFGEALYAMLPTASVKGLLDAASLQVFPRSLLSSSNEFLAADNLSGVPAQEGPPEEDVWYCPHCGDGPYPSWNPCCAMCPSTRSSSIGEGTLHQIFHNYLHDTDDMHGTAQDGPDGSENTWYCDSCGDGPYSEWNPACANCGHKKDSCCHTEGR
ncbi:hypothetical protein K458DRAFT_407255 [Lentithecium fluviatile CBS 122367]|uniref:Uncharacterized protein n=1 Tax=Lentithecium fluviatile CBS 122367 TaxID=1168545 RepID=A0A6G1IQS5_9PLEO|nr:hypothetical protein K458DRAFT_407255 [Lentithecium fluviatile CBS 122367]